MRFKERLDNMRKKKTMRPTALRKTMASYTHDGMDDDDDDDDDELAEYDRGVEDLEHLEQVWRNLESTVQRLVRAIRSGSTTPV